MSTVIDMHQEAHTGEFAVIRLEGMIPIFPDIMIEVPEFELNISSIMEEDKCACSDLVTEDYSPLYAWYNYVLIIFALPALSVFGVCTNFVNIFVYSRKRLQNSANTYLLFLACSDFLVIVTGLFIFWIDSARSYIPELARAPYTTVYMLPVGYMAQTCSIYFTVAAAFDCYVNVCYKSHAKHYCTVLRAKQICLNIVFVSIVYNSLRFPQFNLRKCYHETSQEQIIEICPTYLFFTINTIYNVYMYMVLMTLLPFFILLCLNSIILLRQGANSRKGKTKARPAVKTVPTPSSDSSGDDTITMIMVVILFLACNTLTLVVNIIETFTIPDPLVLNLLTDASNFLVVFNSSVNCVIYIIFNKEYREVLFMHFAGRRSRRQVNRYIPVSLGICENHCGIVENSHERSLPVWQPLSHGPLPNVPWRCYDPAYGFSHADDDVDSGCDEPAPIAVQNSTRPHRHWLAEVNLVDGEPHGYHPRLVTSPLTHFECDSLTATSL